MTERHMRRLLMIALTGMASLAMTGAEANAQSCGYGGGFGGGYSFGGGSYYGGGLGYTNFGNSFGRSYGYSNFNRGFYGNSFRQPYYHDTSWYHGPSLRRHGNHFHVQPGHVHRSGHWHR